MILLKKQSFIFLRIELKQSLLADYVLYFNLKESSILWGGTYDKKTNKIIDGTVTTNKKRFGLFPYKETLATFTADVYPAGKFIPDWECSVDDRLLGCRTDDGWSEGCFISPDDGCLQPA